MRYQELTESPTSTPLDVSSHKEIAHILNTECSDIIKAYKQTGKFLWRGIKGVNDSIVKSTIDKNRRPLEMSGEVHDATNEALTDLGFKAHRGNSIFTTPNINTTDSWGAPFVVFPKNGFEYTWFAEETIGDGYVYHRLNDIRYDAKEYYSQEGLNQTDSDWDFFLIDYFRKRIPELEPTNKNIVEALNKDAEVLITGDYYYAVDETMSKYIDRWVGIERPWDLK